MDFVNKCCNEHGSAHTSSWSCFQFLWMYIGKWDCWTVLFSSFWWNSILFFIAYSKHHISTNGIYLVPVFPHAYKYLLFFLFPKHVEIDGETVETVSDFIFLGSKITVDGDCSHEIKRHLLLERKVMTDLDSILKSRGITLPTKVCLVKGMVFPVVRYGCESWTIKKVERQRINASELWCWGRFLRVPWTARRSNQSILKEISPGCSLEGQMLKLKL